MPTSAITTFSAANAFRMSAIRAVSLSRDRRAIGGAVAERRVGAGERVRVVALHRKAVAAEPDHALPRFHRQPSPAPAACRHARNIVTGRPSGIATAPRAGP